MPSIQFIRLLQESPDNTGWQDEYIYPNPIYPVEALFDQPKEIRMGCYAWRLRLRDRYTGFFYQDDALSELQQKKSLLLPDQYQPWDYTGYSLLLDLFEGPVIYYDWQHQHTINTKLPSPEVFVASLTQPRSILMFNRRVYLLDNNGHRIGQLPVPRSRKEPMYFQWLTSAPFFFSISRMDEKQPSLIHFHEAENGLPLAVFEIDPNRLIPYNQKGYINLKRNTWNLLIRSGTMCVGSGLDKWMQHKFDPITNELRLMVYRPKGPLESYHNKEIVRVKEAWALFQIQA